MLKTRSLNTTVLDDPEFVSERVIVAAENIKDLAYFSKCIVMTA